VVTRDAMRARVGTSMMPHSSLISAKVTVMSEFDYTAPAELFGAHGRAGLRYRRFPRSAEAIRYAMEKLPAGHCPLLQSRLMISATTVRRSVRCTTATAIRSPADNSLGRSGLSTMGSARLQSTQRSTMPKSKKGSGKTEPVQVTQQLYARAYGSRPAKEVGKELESSRRTTTRKKPTAKS
jgi:hypothetical protein